MTAGAGLAEDEHRRLGGLAMGIGLKLRDIDRRRR